MTRIAKAYRYANFEIAFLPQQTERFDGLAVVTSNLLANLDDALIRDLPNLSPLSRAAMQSIPRPPRRGVFKGQLVGG